MAEVEIHTGHGHEIDDFGRAVGVTVGIIGIVLALATISAHRAHSAAIITRTEANDEWAFYQAKKGREHLNDVAAQLAEGLNNDPARVQAMIAKFRTDRDRYAHESEEIMDKAKARDAECVHQEHRALRLDMSEGFLELGLVLSSLYFLSKRRFFPVLGSIAGVAGALLFLWGFLT
ncbi:MAG: DUF4337 domain-containing protein [Proteobacteria bacterium]|nr:DUF4337 domain-containing protein [Pseudomonadota bacterium]